MDPAVHMELAVVDLLVGKIATILENEALLIGGVYDELDELKLELQSMRSFLEDADRKRGLTQGERAWVANVRDMCYPVEDIIEEFMYHMNRPKKDGKFTKLIYGAIHMAKNLWVRHQVAEQIQEINRKLKSISERRQRYGVNEIGGTSSHNDDQRRAQNQGESLVFDEDDRLVGIEDDKRLILEWLTNGEPERTVISVVGMGGSGKSALVAKIYNSPIVKRHFDCYAWITVSQTYIVDDVLKSMIKEFYHSEKRKVPMDLSSMSYKDMIEMLVDYLRPKRYIVILDDVWSNLWKDMNVSLPDKGLGSRVILTTRNEKIAAAPFGTVQSHVHHTKPLDQAEAWNLFCMTAFSSNLQRACPEELRDIALNLVQKCEGLPLALLALGGVMSSKKTVSEWRDFSDSLNHELSSNDDLEEVKRILLLSFNDLPYRLKRCFLYCCVFPEDYPFKRKRLLSLWMAEGFVEEVRAKTLESLANDYLLELVHRNMIQVVRKLNPSESPRTCKLHDMMRELALSMSEKEKFCDVHDGREVNQETSRPARRLSIQKGTHKGIKSFKGISQLRSLFVFVTDMVHPSSPIDTLPSGLRLLRVLEIEDVPVENLPNEVVDLFNLRYLNLKRTKVKELPKSIGRLRNLQTLNICDTQIKVLPAAIVKLEKLRHLIMYHYNRGDPNCHLFGTAAPSSIYKLKNLKVLQNVESEPSLLKQVKNMTQLTDLGITKVKKEDEKDLCTSIGSMNLLRELLVMVTNKEEYLRMDALSSAPPCLRTLFLIGKLEKVPLWFHSLHSLTNLFLRWSKLSEDPLPHIQTLVNLSYLSLIDVYTGDQLCFSAGFNKLKRIELRELPQLNEVTINRGVMPGLQQLDLNNCMELKMLPHGIEHLTKLEELDLKLVSTELIQRIRGEASVDRPRVRHIPKINHSYQSPNGWAYESLSRFDS